MSGRGLTAAELGRAVDAVLEREPTLADLASHGLGLFAAARLEERGLVLPPELVVERRAATMRALAAPAVLERAQSAYSGRVVLMKGPELATRYPDPSCRSYNDLDLLVDDAPAAQAALLAAGFEPVGEAERYVGIHHLRPLALPGLPLPVELHSAPKWPPRLPPPDPVRLLAAAVPSATAVAGVEALPDTEHALLVAAHAWAHEPLQRVRDVLDVAVLASRCDPAELRALAVDWRIERLWASTERAVGAVLAGTPLAGSLALWTRNVTLGRERTVLENHLQRWLSGFAALPPRAALRGLGEALRLELAADEEPWRVKLRRTGRALRNASSPRSAHEDAAGVGRPSR